MNPNPIRPTRRNFVAMASLTLIVALLAACAPANPAAPTAAPTSPPPTAVPAAEAEPVRLEANGEVPFYARFGENEMFSDGQRVVVVFYRPPDCIPADFNLNQFFHLPGETGPGAFGCAPPTTTSVETWANGPEVDPAPLVAEMTGRGAVPVWFLAETEVTALTADGVVTIGDLAALPSRLAGKASTYTELLHPSQTNAQPLIRFTAEGTLDGGGTFSVSVSQGDPAVGNHTTINLEQ
ncbi:MAG: hypothetical protein IT317_16260 [Anaerolineales bacterium]|nr:hypothetical protein [Anaerolineales bacterium]